MKMLCYICDVFNGNVRLTTLARPAAILNNRPILLSEMMLHKDYESKYSVKKMLVVSLRVLVAKTN
jgi:hypothetical protein